MSSEKGIPGSPDANNKLVLFDDCDLCIWLKRPIYGLWKGYIWQFTRWFWRKTLDVVRGIAIIHIENTKKLGHSNIKILKHLPQCLSIWYRLRFWFINSNGPICSTSLLCCGLLNLEVSDTQKASQPFDAYSFGIALLGLLTGKSSVYATGSDEVTHSVRWVRCEADELSFLEERGGCYVTDNHGHLRWRLWIFPFHHHYPH